MLVPTGGLALNDLSEFNLVPISKQQTDGLAESTGEQHPGGCALGVPPNEAPKGNGAVLRFLYDRTALYRFKSERGASAVEMALVLPALVLLLAGIMDFGLVFNDLMALRQGVGAGVRQGVVAQSGTSSTCTITGAAIANTETRKLMCLTKGLIDLDEAETRTMISFPGVKTKGGSLVICAQTPMESKTTIFDPLLSGALKAKVHMRIEQDLSAYGTASETALAGSDWTWCA